MTVNVFLKIDRNVPHTLLCLRFWLETFKNYSTFILCDNPDLSKKLESCFVDYPKSKLINSDRSLVQYLTQLKSSKRNMATANLTGFEQSKDADAFWMIDADDTIFLTHNFEIVNEKLHRAEQYLVDNKLDGFSLDFYSTQIRKNDTKPCDAWTFGVALFRADLNWRELVVVSADEMEEYLFARNIDSVFHCMRARGKWKLESFVFNDLSFQHVYNNYPAMPNGVYHWRKRKLYDIQLPDRIVQL